MRTAYESSAIIFDTKREYAKQIEFFPILELALLDVLFATVIFIVFKIMRLMFVTDKDLCGIHG